MANLTIGLDFGTSATKVVIRDDDDPDNKNWEIRLCSDQAITLPTQLYAANDDDYSLSKSRHFNRIVNSDLKLRLIRSNENTEITQQAKIEAIAFFALLFFCIKKEFSKEFSSTGHIQWSINIGIPCRDADAMQFRENYKHLVQTSWNLSSMIQQDSSILSIRRSVIEDMYEKCRNDKNHGIHSDLINVIPEIIAQVADYVYSPRKKTGIHAIIDVGAYTVDVAFVNIFLRDKQEKVNVYASDVTNTGVYMLIKEHHRLSRFQLSNFLTKKREFDKRRSLLKMLSCLVQTTYHSSRRPRDGTYTTFRGC